MSMAEKLQFAVAIIAFAALVNGVFAYAGARRGRRDSAVKIEAEHAAVLNDTRERLEEHLRWAGEQREGIQGDMDESRVKLAGLESGQRHLTESVSAMVQAMGRTNEKLDTLVGEFRAYRNGQKA